MAKKKKILAIIVFISLLGASIWFARGYFTGQNDGIQATGTIEATSVDLTAKLAGTIEVLNIKSGEPVEKNQLVAKLSRNDLIAQRERDHLSVVKAEANLKDLQSGARSEEIKEAEANVNIAKVNFQRTTDEVARLETLFKAGAATQVELEKAQAAWEINKNQVQSAEARFNLLASGNRKELINAAEIEVERNKAILKATDAMLMDLNIYSPSEGVVLSKNYELGEYVTPGAAIATIVNLDDLWIKVYIPTDDLPHITLGQKVDFTVSGISQSFSGVVEEIATKGEFTPKTIQTKKERTNVVFAVKIRINSEGGILKPGMPADVVFSRGIEND
ncbi:MAG: HlyD family secretion protein [Peptococcales bacterium]|jgi:HlyD family secretion protein